MATNYIPSSKKLIYSRVAELNQVSKAELLEEFSLTSSTMTRLLDEMMAEGLLKVSGYGESKGGRKPILYEVNQGYGYIFGLDISRVVSSLGLFDMQMNARSIVHWRMDEGMTPEQFVTHAANYMKSFQNDLQIRPEQIIGIGIGAVGPIDREQGVIVNPLHFAAPGWTNVPICQMLQEKTGFRTMLENGANTALLGEQWAHRYAGMQHMLYVHAGAGIRSAMMSGGQLVHGTNDMEGAVGQMIIQAGGDRLGEYGNYGALETYVSVESILRKAVMQAKLGRSDLAERYNVPPDAISYDVLLKALAGEDPFVKELFTESAAYFGIGLANLINIFHPEKIILGGALVNSHELFYQTAVEVARKNTYYYPQYEPSFTKGELREDAVATGAAIMVRQALEL
ncbi:ROK family protein [Paenibacillus protaetiae]|uniref:ROK family protein n=1 Tax=Paenibacillus protaetiae TaxID=2509456 RepID=A0A4P6EXK9_9BACL|nr:ROK family protein [Paenibacillus protaetiae]QAY67395.1 ROK family protein [Paenibacillus protaetiae]